MKLSTIIDLALVLLLHGFREQAAELMNLEFKKLERFVLQYCML